MPPHCDGLKVSMKKRSNYPHDDAIGQKSKKEKAEKNKL